MSFNFKLNKFRLSLFTFKHLLLLLLLSLLLLVILVLLVLLLPLLRYFFIIRFRGVAVDRVRVMLVCHNFIS